MKTKNSYILTPEEQTKCAVEGLSLLEAQVDKVLRMQAKEAAKLTDEELRESIEGILFTDLVEVASTHENPPPHVDCMENCGIEMDDMIAASNPFCSPVRSGGEKHKRCMDCWREYIDSLTSQIFSLFLAHEQARVAEEVKAERRRLFYENRDSAATTHRGVTGDYRLITITISEDEYQALSDETK
jgi:hypothetical protein